MNQHIRNQIDCAYAKGVVHTTAMAIVVLLVAAVWRAAW